MSRLIDRLRLGGLDVAALLVLWAVALSVAPGQISEDTKNDLYVDPWGFLGRALHLWDPQVTWGVLQNQGYGYLFPMGPFFGVAGSVLPMWVAQRLWWGLVLTAAYLGVRTLVRALDLPRGVGTGVAEPAAVLASLAYALSPRILSTLGGLSSESLPVAMAPWILAPLVLAEGGRLTPRRAGALSGLGVLACGGVNATATVLAAVPAALFLLTRRGWWSRPLTWWTALAGLAASAWWLGPLLVLGRYSPPFLDWIENSRMVTGPVGLLDVARGTTHWLARLVTPGGAWWPVGFELATTVTMLVVTGSIAALALGGLAHRDLPHRGVIGLMIVLGLLLIAVPHTAPLGSPLAGVAQGVLDGSLAPLRNVHKADPLIRLPLALALAQAFGALGQWLAARTPPARRGAWIVAGGLTVALAAPALTQGIAVRGTFEEMPEHWVQAGHWLDEHRTDGPALLVPASSFGEYHWGRPLDEPIRALSEQPYAVRDSVPLTPAGTIRFLDEIETRLQRGRDLGGAVDALRAQGTRYLVLRNDLDAYGAGQPPVALARSAIRDSPGVAMTAAFGTSFIGDGGLRVQPVEIYDLGPAAPLGELWPARDVTTVAGASEALPALRESGIAGPVVFAGDAGDALPGARQVSTDSNRAREAFFGVTRGRDVSSTLTAREDAAVNDYRVQGSGDRADRTFSGVSSVSASSSLATEAGLLGLWPAHGPAAAADGVESTAWVTAFDDRPTLTVRMGEPWAGGEIEVVPFQDSGVFGDEFAAPTRIEARTDAGVVVLTEEDGVFVGSLAGPVRWVDLVIVATGATEPGQAVTGLAEVRFADRASGAGVRLPSRVPADEVVVTGGRPGTDGCLVGESRRCLAGEYRPAEEKIVRRGLGPLAFTAGRLSGTATLDPVAVSPVHATTRPRVEVSSSATVSTTGGPGALVDGDTRTEWTPRARDRYPEIRLTLPAGQSIESLQLFSPRPWPVAYPVYAEVTVGGNTQTVAVAASGQVELDPVEGDEVVVRLLRTPNGPTRAPVIGELTVNHRPWPASRPALDLPCGAGPQVQLDGVDVPTRMALQEGALPGDALTWEACAPLDLTDAPEHELVIDPGPGLVVLRADLEDAATSVSAGRQGSRLPVAWVSPTRLEGTVPVADEGRLVSLAVNTNAGWRATLDGADLEPVVVDGFRQGFVVPAGAAGELDVRFGPDRAYRWSLLLGAALGVLVLIGLALPGRSPVGHEPDQAERRSWSAASVVVASAAVGWLLLGVAGVAVGLAAACAAEWFGSRPGPALVRVLPPVALLLAAVALQAAVAPATLGPDWLEATTRVLVVAGGTYAVVVGRARAQREV